MRDGTRDQGAWPEPDIVAGTGKVPPTPSVPDYHTHASTLALIAMMNTLKKNDTMLCNIPRRRNDDAVMAQSDVSLHMLNCLASAADLSYDLAVSVAAQPRLP